METGTVVVKKPSGFGFIKREGVAKDLFFHAKEVKGVTFDELQEGSAVTFEVGSNDKGEHAMNVSLA